MLTGFFLDSRYQKGNKFWTKQFSKFKSGVTSTEDDVSLGCTLTSKTGEDMDKLKKSVLKNRHITIHEAANMLKTSFGKFRAFCKTISTVTSLPTSACPAAPPLLYLCLNCWLHIK
jgi:hypothetical protein